MITFCKSSNCPPSEDLLAFQKGEIRDGESEEAITRHLADCDFCATELMFYARITPVEEKVTTVEIPLPLYELADALLGSRQKDFSLLNKLLKPENLTLEKAL